LGVPSLEPWVRSQEQQLGVIRETFSPLPILRVQHRLLEPIGVDALQCVGDELYGALDPLETLSSRQALEITTNGDESVVRVPVCGVDRQDIQVDRSFDELVLTLGEYRRNVRLPDRLRDQEVVRAGLVDGHLEVVFGSEVSRAV
jgi:arsenite-transporting ATPase